MRTYPRNSPQAAARLVALALVADGHVSAVELDTLQQVGIDRLGLDRAGLHGVLHDLCEDLLATAHLTWADECRVDPRSLQELLAEVDDPALRRTVMALAVAGVEADGHVSAGESMLLQAAVECWGLEHERLATPA